MCAKKAAVLRKERIDALKCEKKTKRTMRLATNGCCAKHLARNLQRGDEKMKRAKRTRNLPCSSSNSERSDYQRRQKESMEAGVNAKRPPLGGDPPPEGSWQWTLNWDPVMYKDGQLEHYRTTGKVPDTDLIVGSCPRDAADVDRLIEEANIQAILCLQSDVCHESLGIDWKEVEKRAFERGLLISRVPVYDFDRLDQASMLPEVTRKLGTLIKSERKTYVHCTAGINRANLAALGYLTFVLGFGHDDALRIVKGSRPQANPYSVSWKLARKRLLAGREQELYKITQRHGNSKDQGGDWILRDWESAEVFWLQEYFGRLIEADMDILNSLQRIVEYRVKQLSSLMG